jgi:hypothetical protein
MPENGDPMVFPIVWLAFIAEITLVIILSILTSSMMADLVEDETTCCYAKANKVWTVEPGGLRWEWYRVIEDSETFGAEPDLPAGEQPATEVCCS